MSGRRGGNSSQDLGLRAGWNHLKAWNSSDTGETVEFDDLGILRGFGNVSSLTKISRLHQSLLKNLVRGSHFPALLSQEKTTLSFPKEIKSPYLVVGELVVQEQPRSPPPFST